MNKYKKKLKFGSNNEEYIIKIKKPCKLCLLLLLVPLLLLIRFNNKIDYVLINSCDNSKIADTEIAINYKDNNIELHNIKKKTDLNGVVSFKIKGRRLYEIIFGLNKITSYEVTANANSFGKTLASHKELLVNLIEKTTNLIVSIKKEFVVNVISKKNENLNIPETNIKLKYYINDKETILTCISDKKGVCRFDIPVCAEGIKLFGEKNGYSSDSISTNLVSAKANPDNRKLKLEVLGPEPPRENCRAYFTGRLVGEKVRNTKGIVIPYIVDKWSEYVGSGEYPDNSVAFPKAVGSSFDGIAIDSGTRVIIYKNKNFTGEILFDKTGPAIVNNKDYKNSYAYCDTIVFPIPEIQASFPSSVREWSKTSMHNWSNGSVKIICQ